jgi:phosphoribosylglycinamide formyltransferase-1
MQNDKMKIGFFASHGGSNVQAIIDACKSGWLDMKPAVVICNNFGAYVLERAKKEGIPAYCLNLKNYVTEEALEKAILGVLEKHEVDIIVLAGYMKKVTSKVLEKYKGRILNIHPALLPKFGGKGMYGKFVHEAVLTAGEKISGATVHLADEEYDRGEILGQREVSVLEDDTSEILAARVLEQEHLLYPEVLQKISSGEIKLHLWSKALK